MEKGVLYVKMTLCEYQVSRRELGCYVSKYLIVWVCAIAPHLIKGNPVVYNIQLLSSSIFNQSTLLIGNTFFNFLK